MRQSQCLEVVEDLLQQMMDLKLENIVRLKLDFLYLIRLERIRKKTEILPTLQFKKLQDPNGNRNKIPGMPELRESERRKRDLSTLIFKEKKKFDAYVVIAKENSKKKQLE
ncbi:unnamed protein product [Brugia pahangi]|uniref:Uncharacterized protein n=1 Tax=Brugia pahangi TaxID=6280 RepID=A0A0N4T2S7_BRUPA|nr:unnamed protein product [Brugia pahangi]